MKKYLQICGIILLMGITAQSINADDPPPPPRPSATITFLSPAAADGRIIMDITYANGKVDRIPTGIIREGTSVKDKARALAEAIDKQQTQGVEPILDEGETEATVKIFGEAIKEIKINDATQQTINVNPQDLNPPAEPKNARFFFRSGLGNCVDGTLSLAFNDLDLMVNMATYGKTGLEVAQGLADALSGPAAEHGLMVHVIDMGSNRGELLVLNIPADHSEFTVDPGGACGISCDISVSSGDSDEWVIPTLTEWGLIFLVLATLGIGVFRIFRL